MKPKSFENVDKLVNELKFLLDQGGARNQRRKKLSLYLGVNQSRVSEWLRVPPLARPNGEMVLRLLTWIKENP